jgi:autoinducer 2-degrading protein
MEADVRWIVTVEFRIRAGHARQFLEQMSTQAVESLKEAGCSQFDICIDPADEHHIFLYEIYVDQPAFAAHLASAHFKRFDLATRDWVQSKSVAQWERR